MDRRRFLLAAAVIGAGTSAKADIVFKTPDAGDNTTLQNIDIEAFKAILLNQLVAARLPIPTTFDLFPEQHFLDPVAQNIPVKKTEITRVVGESVQNPYLKNVIRPLTEDYIELPACKTLLLEQSFKEWRIFVALHEITHYVASKLTHGGADLNDQTFSAVNQIPNQRALDYIHKLAAHYPKRGDVHQAINDEDRIYGMDTLSRQKNVDALLVALKTEAQIPDDIADVSAALYILSNYGNTKENRDFIQAIADDRRAFYMDYAHDTADAIQNAVKLFSARPVKNMSIVETTKLAALIVQNQLSSDHNISIMAAHIRSDVEHRAKLHDHYGVNNSAWEHDTINARNRACAITAKLEP